MGSEDMDIAIQVNVVIDMTVGHSIRIQHHLTGDLSEFFELSFIDRVW